MTFFSLSCVQHGPSSRGSTHKEKNLFLQGKNIYFEFDPAEKSVKMAEFLSLEVYPLSFNI